MVGRIRLNGWIQFGVLAGATLLATSALSHSTERRPLLGTLTMAESRGNNQQYVLVMEPCNEINGFSPCTAYQDPCGMCGTSQITMAQVGVNGGYNPGGIQNCGTKWTGTCSRSLVCRQSEAKVKCSAPPGPPVQQSP